MKKYSLLFISLLLVLSSCSSSSEKSELQYFPFKESKGDNWGLIDASGKVLIADEFKGEPTAVINGMFFVKTDDAIELYKATDPTKPVGEKFKAITSFHGKYAPSVKKGEGIKYVDENGRIVSELPLDYNKATAFDKGYSLITLKTENETEVVGVIDEKFNIIQHKKYSICKVVSSNRFLATKLDDEETNYYIIDNKGKEISKFKPGFIELSDDMKMYIFSDGEKFGVKSIDGNVIVRAKYDFAKILNNEYICVRNENGCGIVDTKGEVIVKNRYSEIIALSGDKFIAKRDGDDGYGLLNLTEERIVKYDYKYLVFIPGSKNLIGRKNNDNYVYLLNSQGDILSEYSTISIDYLARNIWGDGEPECVYSDFYDVNALFKAIFIPEADRNITKMLGYLGRSAESVASEQKLDLSYSDISNRYGYQWLPTRKLSSDGIEFKYGSYKYTLGFNSIVESYEDYSSSYYYPQTRYRFASNSKCQCIHVVVELNYENLSHLETIKAGIKPAMNNLGFSNLEEDDNKYLINTNDKTINISFNYDEIDIRIMPESSTDAETSATKQID